MIAIAGARKPQYRYLDYRILGLLVAMTLLSLLFLHSAGYNPSTGKYMPFMQKQAMWALVSAAAVFVLTRVPYRFLLDRAYLLYTGGILLLLLVKVAGTELNHARRWIDLRFMLLQPSEFMKVILIVTLARYIRWRDDYKKLRGLVRPFLLTLLPMALILQQPDLGTALLFVPILMVLLYVAGARAKHLGLVVLMGLVCAPIVFFVFLKPYQRDRLLVFTRLGKVEESERQGKGYHLHRSMVAVGSGGVFGKGLSEGDQRVPENETDFIFTVVAEEWGLTGSLLVLGLYAALFGLLAWSAVEVKEPSGKLVIVGVLTLLFVQTGVNLAMTVGLAPITGLTLPFLSYGGSSLLSLSLAVGLALNVKLYPEYPFKRDF